LHFAFAAAALLRKGIDMRWRAFAVGSLGVNVLLAAIWLLSARHHAVSPSAIAAGLGFGPQPKTNIVVRRQFFSWQEVESPDYPTYIANLRDIGCPEQTIRDIIVADVNALYARRRATELLTPEQQWWRSEPDTNVLRTAIEKVRAMEDERRALLVRLLGTGWETGDIVSLPRPSRPGILLDGPVLGVLPAETKQALQDISARSQERLQTYLDALRQNGKEPDPGDLAKLRQQTRDDLARVLSPQQLEEFLLRYSQEANNLRADFGQLAYFNPTPDEFRAVFRATDTLDQQIQLLTGNDPNTVQARNALQDQRENAIKTALGPKRYEDYRLLQDPLYRDAVAAAQQAGTPEAAMTFYQINQAAAEEQDDIASNTNLTAQQKAIEMKRLELEQLQANTLAAGQQLPPEPPAPPRPPARHTYTIQPGDTVAVVSIIYGVPVSAIRAANPNLNLNRLNPGDMLVIPRNPLSPVPPP
jgi:LysM repeat protein